MKFILELHRSHGNGSNRVQSASPTCCTPANDANSQIGGEQDSARYGTKIPGYWKIKYSSRG